MAAGIDVRHRKRCTSARGDGKCCDATFQAYVYDKRSGKLIRHTERTITELEPLLEELARIRRRGYGTALGEYELGLNAVAGRPPDEHDAHRSMCPGGREQPRDG